jgi:hypothetical protein
LIIDISYALIDPRIRYEWGELKWMRN